ncbi:hypothetical protein FOE74_04925 [Rufibacter glacialis]|uniref:Uncharacterized protein n=1 Tax=Rufibacter glacialis TaxID=1259555 RepID=A0A5M8QGX9_9BACT|nr:hypothetical protein FOE74_04925 [Rufibacter glacialis]
MIHKAEKNSNSRRRCWCYHQQRLYNGTKALIGKDQKVFPPWQGRQCLRYMLSGEVNVAPLDNDRYRQMRWTSVQEGLATR